MPLRPLPIRDENRDDPDARTVYNEGRGGWYPPADKDQEKDKPRQGR
ncbi:MAG TPA: hypothetical protein VK545_22165 [Streptomyces sp.]|nr:hypothetical protein [Streptomyces sp.]